MAVHHLTSDSIQLLQEVSFAECGLKERGDLQRLLRANIAAVAPGVLVVSEEFGEWEDSRRRIDLLGIDRAGKLVVIELKRDDDGGHMELQALRYAAMVSSMTFSQMESAYALHLERHGITSNVRDQLLEFLGWDDVKEDDFGRDVRIVLVASDFSKEITTTALWLNNRGIDVRCVRLKPYRVQEHIVVDAQQIIPLPETQEFQIQVRRKSEAVQEATERQPLQREFWQMLLRVASSRTTRFAGISPGDGGWISAAAGVPGFRFAYMGWMQSSGVELVVDKGAGTEAFNKAAFNFLFERKEAIESAYGGPLHWMPLPGRQSSKIQDDSIEGGIRTSKEEWSRIHAQMVDAMSRFELSLGPYLRPAAEYASAKA